MSLVLSALKGAKSPELLSGHLRKNGLLDESYEMVGSRSGRPQPRVSICVPAYNAEMFLAETLATLINQDDGDLEILLLDNASSDQTSSAGLAILEASDRDFRVVRSKVNRGYAGNCNLGIALARGRYVAIFHGDDLYDTSLVRTQADILDSRADLLGCFCFPACIDEVGADVSRTPYAVEADRHRLLTVDLSDYLRTYCVTGDNILFCPSSMIRADAYQTVGGYDANRRLIEDLDMWLRLLTQGPLGIINRRLVRYRVHSGQGSAEYRDGAPDVRGKDIERLEEFLRVTPVREDAARLQQQLLRLRARRQIKLALELARRGQRSAPQIAALLTASEELHRFSISEFKFWAVQRFPRAVAAGTRMWRRNA